MSQKVAFQMIAEMKEFATFTAAEQRYIRRSLDVAELGIAATERWSRNAGEAASIHSQARLYRTVLDPIRTTIPDDIAFEPAAEFISSLMAVTAFDLAEGRLGSFAAYRFLYERLFGGAARAWLPSAFLAASALPCFHPSTRKALLGSVSASDVAAAGWSSRNPAFTPEWVEKVPVTVC